MLKSLLKTVYLIFPFRFKFFLKDMYFYFRSNFNNAVSIKTISVNRGSSKVAVLGNGPSLKKDKLLLSEKLNEYDYVCVNNFCDDALYEKIKPKLYVFLDGYFFSENTHPDWIVRREKTFRKINDTTSWPMKIILPHSADERILKKNIKNKNIEILKINTQSIFLSKYNKFVGLLFDSGIYGPPQINVLIYAIYLSIICKYSEIHVYGADLSLHIDVNVNQEDNDLFINFRHFNEQDKIEPFRKNPGKINRWTMAEFLKLSSDTFYAHEILYSYAQSRRIKIINCSSYSMIDAYPRLRLDHEIGRPKLNDL